MAFAAWTEWIWRAASFSQICGLQIPGLRSRFRFWRLRFGRTSRQYGQMPALDGRFPFELFILGQLTGLPVCKISHPGGKIAALYPRYQPGLTKECDPRSCPKEAVMGNQDKSPFLLEVSCDGFSGSCIQVVGRLVDQKKMALI